MSTKASIQWGDIDGIGIHLYEEVMENDAVYLELTAEKPGIALEYEASPARVMLRIPLPVWELIRRGTHGILASDLAGKTDDQLEEIATTHVTDRMDAHLKGNKMSALLGSWTLGSVDLPVEEQIKNGLNYYKGIRDHVASVHAAVKASDDKNEALRTKMRGD